MMTNAMYFVQHLEDLQVAAMGNAQECRKKVEEFEKAGASFVILFPMAIEGDYDRGVRATLEAFGQ